jgi:hypothetical protein
MKQKSAVKKNAKRVMAAISKCGSEHFDEYTPQRGPKLIATMRCGYSLKVAAEMMGVDYQTICKWAAKHSEFVEAIRIAKGLRLFFLETQLLEATSARSVRAALHELKRACPEEWGDKDGRPL